jgi:hypothetical protein
MPLKLALLALALALAQVDCANPLVPNVGMADPHVHVFNGSFFLYATNDFSNTNTGFVMKSWRIWSSPDLVTWTLATTLEPQDTPANPSVYDSCWATDAAQGPDGQYYWYLSIGGDQVRAFSFYNRIWQPPPHMDGLEDGNAE